MKAMNKVTPKAGQRWVCNKTCEPMHEGNTLKIVSVNYSDMSVGYEFRSRRSRFNLNIFIDKFEFAPANDLEWLAINCINTEITERKGIRYFVARDAEIVRWCEDNHNGLEWYFIDRLIECRYKLGIDERPSANKDVNISCG